MASVILDDHFTCPIEKLGLADGKLWLTFRIRTFDEARLIPALPQYVILGDDGKECFRGRLGTTGGAFSEECWISSAAEWKVTMDLALTMYSERLF